MHESSEISNQGEVKKLVPEDKNSIPNIIGQILINKGYKIKIEAAYVSTEISLEKMNGFVDLTMSEPVAQLFDKVNESPEARTLSQMKGPRDADEDFNVDACEWDDNTKKRVLALYWQNRSIDKKKAASEAWRFGSWSEDRFLIDQYESDEKKYNIKSRELLEKRKKLNPKKDFIKLLEPAVQRAIAV